MNPSLLVYLLGDLQLKRGETQGNTMPLPRVQSLFAYLLLHRQASIDRSQLAFLFWPESTEAQAHTNLRKLLFQLRQQIPEVNTFLLVDKHRVQWCPDNRCWLDVQEVEAAYALAKQTELTQDTTTLRQALERVVHVYRGDLLRGCYEEWILPERDRLRQLFLVAAQHLISLLEQDRDYDAAIATALLLLRHDPLHEGGYQVLMRLYALTGNRAGALHTYHTCAQTLERELGVGPSAVTLDLYARLVLPAGAAVVPPPASGQQRIEPPLLGRTAEWRRLQQIWNAATGGGLAGSQTGKVQLALLSGEAGIGKTRLAHELEVWVRRLGMATAQARCYATLANLAYAPITSWLRSDVFQTSLSSLDPSAQIEIARLLPEMLANQPNLAQPDPMTERWQRQYFFAALVRAVLSASQPLLLLLDDLQWCDQETLEWLQYLFATAPEARILLVGTMRAEETLPSHPLVSWLRALHREALVTEITLGALTLAETTSLAQHILADQFDATGMNRLYQETEGNPLFIVEMLQTCTAMTQASTDAVATGQLSLLTNTSSSLPPAIQTVLAARLAQLSNPARTIANVAAVIGGEFSSAMLAQTGGETEAQVVQGLDELWQRRIIQEHDGNASHTYDFSHEKFRELIYSTMSPVQRRHLHLRVAEALKVVYSADLDAVCGQIAAHYEQAGHPAPALRFYQQAGIVARQISAHVEALHAYQRAIDVLAAHLPGKGLPLVPWETVAQIAMEFGDLQADLGSHQEARQSYQRAMSALPPAEHIWRARLVWKSATTWMYASATRQDPSFVTGCEAFAEAERLLRRVEDHTNPDWRAEWIALHFAQIWQGRRSADEMEQVIAQAKPIVEQYGTHEQRKLLAEAVGMHKAICNQYVVSAATIAAWRANIVALAASANERQRGIDLALFGIGLLCAAQFDEAEVQLSTALQVGDQIGNAWLQHHCLTFLPFVFRARGQVEAMRAILAQAQARGIDQQSPLFAGHHAWVAWRDGDLSLALTYGRASVSEEQSRQFRTNPFLWVGRWPLIGVALAQTKTEDAITDIRRLFEPTQQPPREPLAALLTSVLRAWDAARAEEAQVLLQQAMPLAAQMGYL